MAIPDFQTIMLPLMRHLQDGREHPTDETLDALAEHFELTEEERRALLPLRIQAVFTNRVAWAKSHLKKQVFLANRTRGLARSRTGREACRIAQAINLRFSTSFLNTSLRAIHRAAGRNGDRTNHDGTPEERWRPPMPNTGTLHPTFFSGSRRARRSFLSVWWWRSSSRWGTAADVMTRARP